MEEIGVGMGVLDMGFEDVGGLRGGSVGGSGLWEVRRQWRERRSCVWKGFDAHTLLNLFS